MSVTAGTIFQDSGLPLCFRATWYVTNQKNGISALGIQQVLGLGSCQTAWAWLYKLRRAMVRPVQGRFSGRAELNESYTDGEEPGVVGRPTHTKALVPIMAQEDGRGIERIRLGQVPVLTQAVGRAFVTQAVEPGSLARTDRLNVYAGPAGYEREAIMVQRQAQDASALPPRVHRVAALLKCWLLGPHQGAVRAGRLDYYLDEFTLRFNRRHSASRGKLLYRLAQHAVQVPRQPYHALIHLPPIGGG